METIRRTVSTMKHKMEYFIHEGNVNSDST
jgi:hypothetical protein